MNRNEITTAVQTGPPASRAQGASTIWKMFNFNFTIWAVMWFIMLTLQQWNAEIIHTNIYNLIHRAIWAISVSLGVKSFGVLNREGFRNLSCIYAGCYFIFFIVSFALFFSRPNWNVAIGYWFYVSCGIYASPFFLALYLNHRLKKSSTEATVADAN
ncbi:MAG: hypothetical protein WCA21_18880 [Terracidiphilus sp.]